MTDKPFLTQHELSQRWRISTSTLERWRCRGEGPRFTKIGGVVRYSIKDVLKYEATKQLSITEKSDGRTPVPGGAA